MAREREGYREQLEVLMNHFGDVGMVSKAEVAEYTRHSTSESAKRWVKERLGVGRNGITLPVLAWRLLELCDE